MDPLIEVIESLLTKMEPLNEYTLYMNREMQLKLEHLALSLISADIEPDFTGRQYKGIPIMIDDTLKDKQITIKKNNPPWANHYIKRFMDVV